MDIKYINLGILLKDNTFHWNKQLGRDVSVRGLIGDDNFSLLSKGSPVILDSDHIYSERMFNFLSKRKENNFKSLPGYQYEQRYQKELADMLNDEKSNVVDGKRIK